MSYTKLFTSIITSTIWSEDDQTRIVWITMLALADKNGEVQGSVPGIARMAGVSVDSARAAIAKFLGPDPDSRTKDDEGRRIEEIDGGWLLLNHRKYREMASDADRAEKSAARQKRFREKQQRNSNATPRNATVTPESRQIPQAEADTDTDTDTRALSVRAGEVEIPPVTLEAAKANAGQYGATPEIAERWWLNRDAANWIDGKRRQIVRWGSDLQGYSITWRAKENEAKRPAANGHGKPMPGQFDKIAPDFAF